MFALHAATTWWTISDNNVDWYVSSGRTIERDLLASPTHQYYDHVRCVIGAICIITVGGNNGRGSTCPPSVGVLANLRSRVFVSVAARLCKKLNLYSVLVSGRLSFDVQVYTSKARLQWRCALSRNAQSITDEISNKVRPVKIHLITTELN